MKRFTDAGRLCLNADNLYAALSLALMVPDICSFIEEPGPNNSKARYERWCRKWVEPKFHSPASLLFPEQQFLTAEDCYQIRCSLIHSGSSEIPHARRGKVDSFEFFDDTYRSHCNYVGGNVINGVVQAKLLQLNARQFSEQMYHAADEWDDSITHDPKLQAEKKKLLTIHSAGAVLGGIQFGNPVKS